MQERVCIIKRETGIIDKRNKNKKKKVEYAKRKKKKLKFHYPEFFFQYQRKKSKPLREIKQKNYSIFTLT